MCDRVSGTCHRYTIAHVTANRVHVEYSNPDEYGSESPMQAVFPAWQTAGWNHDGKDTFVVLDLLNVYHDNHDGEGWQSFQCLLDCPELFRQSPDDTLWRSRQEWEAIKVAAQQEHVATIG